MSDVAARVNEQTVFERPGPIRRGVDAVVGRLARGAVQTRAIGRTLTVTSGGVSSLQGLRLSESERRWSSSSMAYRAITAISSNASSLDLTVLRESGELIEGHWLTRLWANPNPLMSGRVMGEYVWQRMETRGESFLFLDRGESGTLREPAAMWPIFGDVTVVVDKNLAGEIVGYVVNVGGKLVPLLANEVLWLRYPDAENEWGALPPLRAAAHAVGLDALARAWQKGELENGGRPTAVVSLGDLEEEQHNDAVAAYRSRIEGPNNAGRTLFVSSAVPAKVERLSLTPEELGWLDTRKVSWEEITVALGVPKDYLLGGATHENRDAARSTLWSDTIIPKLEVVAGEAARQLLAPNERARFDTDDVDALRENEDSRAKRTNEAVDRDLMTIDEARAAYGLEPIGGEIGNMTLTAYRAWVQLGAQTLLLQADPSARQMPALRVGPMKPVEGTSPLALPVAAPQRRAGLSFDQAQHEYDMHERVGLRAVKRLASKQEAVVLQNLHKLYGRSGAWATKRAELEASAKAYLAGQALPADERAAVIEALQLDLRAKVDDLLDAERAQAMTREQVESFLSGVWVRGGQTTAQMLGVGFDVFEPDVLDRMDERLTVLGAQLTETTRTVLEERVLLEGVANGETVDELAARVRAVFTDLSSRRAQMIARTETVSGFNTASHVTAVESGVVTGKAWLSTGDARTRDSHIDLDGVSLSDLDAKFANGCRFPGDMGGPAEEVILCRCVLQYDVD